MMNGIKIFSEYPPAGGRGVDVTKLRVGVGPAVDVADGVEVKVEVGAKVGLEVGVETGTDVAPGVGRIGATLT